jgi:hypothetical protein
MAHPWFPNRIEVQDMSLTFTVRSDDSREAETALAVTLVMLPQYV